ncbi:MAG: helix-turn-helix domain-containing protein [Clostridia bacterium]|nr:helix-turn-helix domain-containing protein [Clostridia bacterium]
MLEISLGIGQRIRYYRKSRNMTLEELASAVNKSKATLSKYEKGQIVLDIETLYDIADVLRVHVDQLLVSSKPEAEIVYEEVNPSFFRGLNRFYAYYYDGRIRKINRSVCDILSRTETNQFKLIMYMNCSDLEQYQQCENTYIGYIRHFDALSIIEVVHQTNPMEHGSIQILATFMDSEVKWGLWNGISSRPLMPVALKMLFSKKPLKEDERLIKQLKISKDDIRTMKLYNFFAVT